MTPWAEFVHMLLKLMAERYRTELINFVEQASGTLVLTKSGFAYVCDCCFKQVAHF